MRFMTDLPRRPARWTCALILVTCLAWTGPARGQGTVRRVPADPYAPCADCPVAPARPLGTFYPQPYTFVPGNGIAGGGYSPLNIQGAGTLAEYGPLSMYRQVAVPVTVYSRGYNGVAIPEPATSLIYPNLPNLNPATGRAAIAFPPTRRYYRPFQAGPGSINWIDQN